MANGKLVCGWMLCAMLTPRLRTRRIPTARVEVPRLCGSLIQCDKPFDEFLREQLAGDELVPGAPQNADDADALIATGYLRLGQWDSTAAIFRKKIDSAPNRWRT
jgi:hypothetical protein